MNKFVFPIVLAAVAVAAAAGSATLSGKWHVHNSIEGNESDQSCTFTQSGHVLTGSCLGEHGTVKVSGTVEGEKVRWSYQMQYQGSPLTVNYEGTVDDSGHIVGDVNVPEYSADGDFTAARTK